MPHKVDTSKFEHFADIHILVIPYRRSIDILVGQSDKTLLTVLEEREGFDPDQPNCVFTRLGPIASGGRLDVRSNLIQNRKVDVGPKPFNWDESDELRKKNAILEKRLRELELLDESIQPSKSDEMAKEIVESGIKVVGHRYEIPVPLKPEVVKNLTNNYDYALKRTKAMKSSALRNPELKLTLLNTFQGLIDREMDRAR